MRFTLAFGLCGLALAAMALRPARPAVGLGWLPIAVEWYLASCCLTLALAYGFRSAGRDVERFAFRAGWSIIVRTILLPYLALGAVTLYLARWFDREALLNPVAPGIAIGRLPFPSERIELERVGIRAVLNLCWEFPRVSGIDRVPGLATARVPILDGAAPTDRQFRDACACVARWRAEGRFVLIHCAQGHGRTATVAAAVLCELGLASDAEEALSLIRSARPLARPCGEQRAALARFLASD